MSDLGEEHRGHGCCEDPDGPSDEGVVIVDYLDARSWNGLLREVCKNCGHESPVGFSVPHDVWARSVPALYLEQTLCILCFAYFADKALERWDEDIKFYPVSLATHRQLETSPTDDTPLKTKANVTAENH